MRVRFNRVLPMMAVLGTGLVLSASPASAADDSFAVWSVDHCGYGQFIDDEASGLPEDQVVAYDYCDDGLDVQASVWEGWSSLGAVYTSGGPGSPPVMWEPFAGDDGTHNGDHIQLVICLVAPNDPEYHTYSCGYQDVYLDD